jgi:hypothetical protein
MDAGLRDPVVNRMIARSLRHPDAVEGSTDAGSALAIDSNAMLQHPTRMARIPVVSAATAA